MTFQRVLTRLCRTLGDITTVGCRLLFDQISNILTSKIPAEILEVSSALSSALSSYQSSIPPWSILSSIRKSLKFCWRTGGDVRWDVCDTQCDGIMTGRVTYLSLVSGIQRLMLTNYYHQHLTTNTTNNTDIIWHILCSLLVVYF